MNFSHANCTHPKTPKARAACRKARAKGQPTTNLVPTPALITRPGIMSESEAVRLAEDLLRQHGLIGWHVTLDNARRRAGACNYMRRRIQLSRYLLRQRSYAETEMTITHEVAHALTPGHNHDEVWRAQFVAMGGNGARTFNHVDTSAPYIGTCAHGKQFAKYRVPKSGFQGWRCRCAGHAPSPITWVKNA